MMDFEAPAQRQGGSEFRRNLQTPSFRVKDAMKDYKLMILKGNIGFSEFAALVSVIGSAGLL